MDALGTCFEAKPQGHSLLENYVVGCRIAIEAEEQLGIADPATGELLVQVRLSGESDLDWTVQGAIEYFEKWREGIVTRRARSRYMQLPNVQLQHKQ